MFGEGTLVACGTAESPITFTSNRFPSAAGDWSRIHFTDYATDAALDEQGNYQAGCALEHVIVEYAGHGDYGAIFAEKSSPLLRHCMVRHNSYWGIRVDGTDAPSILIENCEVWDNTATGISVTGGSGHALLGNSSHDNAGGGIGFGDYNGNNTLDGNIVSNNAGEGIYFARYCDGNTLSGNTITENTANNEGGAIYFHDSDNNTFSSNIIIRNETTGGQTGGIYVTYGSNWLSLAGDPEAGEYNLVCANDGYQVYNNGFYADGRNDVDARHVQWGTDDTQQIQDGIFDYFDDATKAFVGWYPFLIPGDVNGNGEVDVFDVIATVNAFGTSPGDPNWDPWCDQDGSGAVDVFDIITVVNNFGRSI